MSKTEKILLIKPYGKHLGISGISFTIRKNKRIIEKIPFFKVGKIFLQSGNSVSVGSLATSGFYGIDVVILTASGKPVAILKPLDSEHNVKTRIKQYQAYYNEKGIKIATEITQGKIESQLLMLEKYGFEHYEKPEIRLNVKTLKDARHKLNSFEGAYSKDYFLKIGKLLNIEERKGLDAYDGTNNLLNLAYEILQWKIHSAILTSRLDAYLGYLHGIKHERPSLMCDLEELYRVWIDDFVIKYKQEHKLKFETVYKTRKIGRRRGTAPRKFLEHKQTNHFIEKLSEYFETSIPVKRIQRGKTQKLETLIQDEVTLLSKYLREEKDDWKPRIIIPD